MRRITAKVEFDAGHRVWRHEGKCAHLHGHRYTAWITVHSPGLDAIGRVIDFGEIKRIAKEWIDSNWDHNLLLHPEDPLLKALRIDDARARQATKALSHATPVSDEVFNHRKPFIMPPDMNPTAENIASVLWGSLAPLIPEPVRLFKIRLFETPNFYADYFGDNHKRTP